MADEAVVNPFKFFAAILLLWTMEKQPLYKSRVVICVFVKHILFVDSFFLNHNLIYQLKETEAMEHIVPLKKVDSCKIYSRLIHCQNSVKSKLGNLTELGIDLRVLNRSQRGCHKVPRSDRFFNYF